MRIKKERAAGPDGFKRPVQGNARRLSAACGGGHPYVKPAHAAI